MDADSTAALPEMKYSRAVVFKVDQESAPSNSFGNTAKSAVTAGTAPVTSLTQYEDDKDSIMVYSATPEMVLVKGKAVGAPSPYLQEFKWGSTEPAVEIRINGSMGYQAMPFRVQKAFNHAK